MLESGEPGAHEPDVPHVQPTEPDVNTPSMEHDQQPGTSRHTDQVKCKCMIHPKPKVIIVLSRHPRNKKKSAEVL